MNEAPHDWMTASWMNRQRAEAEAKRAAAANRDAMLLGHYGKQKAAQANGTYSASKEWSPPADELTRFISREVSGIRATVSDGTAALFDEVLEGAGVSPEKIGGTEPLAHAFVGAGESLANWWLDHPEESQAAMAARLMNVAWIGLSELLQSRAEPWPLDHEPGSATRASSSPRTRRRTRKRT